MALLVEAAAGVASEGLADFYRGPALLIATQCVAQVRGNIRGSMCRECTHDRERRCVRGSFVRRPDGPERCAGPAATRPCWLPRYRDGGGPVSGAQSPRAAAALPILAGSHGLASVTRMAGAGHSPSLKRGVAVLEKRVDFALQFPEAVLHCRHRS